MSLINDALKQARQNPPADAPPTAPQPMPSLQPVAHRPVPVAGWLIPAVVIFLIVAAVFFMGWALAHRSVNTKVVVAASAAAAAATAPAPASVASMPAAVAAPPAAVPALAPTTAPPATVVQPPALPVLQGIFYSPTAPSAIVNGKTVRPGDAFNQYRVQEITRSTLTLVDAAGKATKLVMGN